jgi:Condensation domain
MQRRDWERVTQFGSQQVQRMCVSAVRVLGPLDVEVLRRSIEALINRHESLRTRLVTKGELPQQYIDEPRPYRLNIVDLSGQSEKGRASEARRLAQEFVDQKIDLLLGPLFEARLWKLSAGEHVLALMISHFVSDGMSNGILVRELWTLYDQAARSQSFSLPTLPIQYPDVAVWQQRTHMAWLKDHESYWRDHLKGLRRLELPSDFRLEDAPDPVGLTVNFPFGDMLSSKLRECARRERTLLPLVVLTVYAIVMSHWCCQDDLLIWMLSHGRQGRPELQNMIGYLASPLPLRVKLTGEDTFRSLLTKIQLEFSSAFLHEEFGCVPDFIPECQSEIVFNWQPTRWVRGRLDHHVILECASAIDRRLGEIQASQLGNCDNQIKTEPFAVRTPEVLKFSPVFFDATAGIHMAVGYRSDLFTQQCITHFARNVLGAAEEFAENPATRVAVANTRMRWAGDLDASSWPAHETNVS